MFKNQSVTFVQRSQNSKKAAQSCLNRSSDNTALKPKPPALSKPGGQEVPGAINLGE